MVQSSRRTGKVQFGLVLVVSAAHFMHDSFTALLAPLLPLFIENLGLTLFQAGSLAVATQLPSLLNPLLGALTDRHRLHRLLVIVAPGATGTLICLAGLAPSYGILLILLFTAGFSIAGIHVAGPVLIRRFSADAVGRGMSMFMVGGELARTIGPLIAVGLVSSVGLRGLWRVIPVAVAASLVLWWRLADVSPGPPVERQPILFALWRRMRSVLVGVTGILVARSFMVGALATFLPTFIYGNGHSLWMANISFSVMELCGALGVFMSGTLSDKLGRRQVLYWSVGLAPPLMLLFVVSDGWTMLLLLAMLGFVALSTMPVLLAVVIEHSGSSPAAATGTLMMVSFAVRGLVILLVGAMGDALGLHTAFLACGAIAVLGLPCIRLLPPDAGPDAT